MLTHSDNVSEGPYWYQVKATNIVGSSVYSAAVRLYAATTPDAPKALTEVSKT